MKKKLNVILSLDGSLCFETYRSQIIFKGLLFYKIQPKYCLYHFLIYKYDHLTLYLPNYTINKLTNKFKRAHKYFIFFLNKRDKITKITSKFQKNV